MSDNLLREEICRVGRSLYDRGYVHASAGNISARVDDGFLITPTDACLGTLQPKQLAHVNGAGEQLSGERASKTLLLHRRVYDADPAAQCVIHTHSTHLVALTLAGVWRDDCILPPITPYLVMKLGRVPLVGYHRPGDPAVADRVVEHISAASRHGSTLRAVMLERLGPLVWHASPAEAMAALEELEESARLWLMTDPRPAPLTDAQIALLCSTFAVRW
jgi:ribulose-5-phosphate 4-epimerase/fuculose-1-phosphate aldolase